MFSWVLLIPSSMYALDSTTITAAAARVKPTPTRARLCATRARLCAVYRGPATITRLAFATTASVRTRSLTISNVDSSFAGLAPCLR